MDRGDLNKRLLDELESLPNVKFKFNHKLTGADFKNKKAWFEVHGGKSLQWSVEIRDQEVEVDFDFLIGADGAHSATRYHLMKYLRMDYQQEYIDTLWCEFTIDAQEQIGEDSASRFKISPHHLHIWPGKDFMFIAIPSTVCRPIFLFLSIIFSHKLGWLIYLYSLHAIETVQRARNRP